MCFERCTACLVRLTKAADELYGKLLGCSGSVANDVEAYLQQPLVHQVGAKQDQNEHLDHSFASSLLQGVHMASMSHRLYSHPYAYLKSVTPIPLGVG